jgi:hypothetical protein
MPRRLPSVAHAFHRCMCVSAFALVASFAAKDLRADSALAATGDARKPVTTGEVAKAATEASKPKQAGDLDPRRYELAGFPILGGNSDIGFQFGGAATWTRFYDGARPYLWNVDLLLSASLKDDANGFRMVQQSHVLRLDLPDLWNSRLRVDVRASYQRTINAGYFGLGNATTTDLPAGQTSTGRTFQYTQEEGRVRTIARLHTDSLFDVALGVNLRYEAPATYAASRLAQDLAQTDPSQPGLPLIPGGDSMLLAGIAAGFIVDTRDSEFITRSGFFYQLGVGATVGSTDQTGYGEAAIVLAHFAPLGGPFSFASRFVGSMQFGRVPFYDLQQAGVFEPQYLVGGENGVRGVPQGRYAGRAKFAQNTEIRATPFPHFHLLGQRLLVGTTAFFDAGRVWSDYAVISQADGNSLGMKFGIGGGLFLQWGEAAIFRVEAAYSPDAVSENPGFPIGLYVSDGLMF